jgi:hypothetical protein
VLDRWSNGSAGQTGLRLTDELLDAEFLSLMKRASAVQEQLGERLIRYL